MNRNSRLIPLQVTPIFFVCFVVVETIVLVPRGVDFKLWYHDENWLSIVLLDNDNLLTQIKKKYYSGQKLFVFVKIFYKLLTHPCEF